ncbi:transposase [Streptomyces azureus]|uniref:Transposase n=1 Tax=Streptomyces azureus TaxID=146537 RepID=A0A0K8PK49_STRAJ|nr:transposase [Streptomyces azureus]
MKTNDLAMAAGRGVGHCPLAGAFEGLKSRIAERFPRGEPRRRVRDLMLGLLSDLPRKNCWNIAEWAGEATPDGMQHLLGRARWDADAVRDECASTTWSICTTRVQCWWSTRPGT